MTDIKTETITKKERRTRDSGILIRLTRNEVEEINEAVRLSNKTKVDYVLDVIRADVIKNQKR